MTQKPTSAYLAVTNAQAGCRLATTASVRPPQNTPRRERFLAPFLIALVVLGGCASDDTTRSGLFEPYRTDLPQGNYLTRELLDQVRPGMRETQVKRILGTPLLTDVFQPRQANYVFSFKHPSGRVDLRRVLIVYDNNAQVASIEADELPQSESPSDPALPGFRKEAYGRSN